MSCEVYVTIHVEFDFRKEQLAEDRFEFYPTGRDSYWLNEQEVRAFRDRLTEALAVYEKAGKHTTEAGTEAA